VPRVKYAMNYRPTNSFSMSYASREVIFPDVPSPANFKFLRYIKAWILPLDGSVDNHFCTIHNSISLFVLDHSQQYSRHSGRYTVEDIQWQIYIQWQIHSGGYSGRYTISDQDTHSQGQIHRGRYTAVDIQWQNQWQIYNTANTADTVADTRQQIHCGRYKMVDIQR